MKFKNVLLASDFDGTLKNDDGIITPDVIEKIKYFIRHFSPLTNLIYAFSILKWAFAVIFFEHIIKIVFRFKL